MTPEHAQAEAKASLLVSEVDVHGMPAQERIGAGYHDVSFCRDSWSAADPLDADVRRGTETIRELRAVVLDVADVHQLMLQLRHVVPTETAFGAVEIKRVYRIIDDAIAEGPVLEHLRLRIWVALDTVIAASMLRPPLKRRFVPLQIQVRKKQRVIRHLPERVLVIGVRPLVCRTALDGLTQHRERSVVLALENGPEHGIRHGTSHATSGPHRRGVVRVAA